MDGWMDGWMGGWKDGWMGGWMDGWMDGEDLITWLAEKVDLDLWFDLVSGDARPLFQAAVGRPGPNVGPVHCTRQTC